MPIARLFATAAIRDSFILCIILDFQEVCMRLSLSILGFVAGVAMAMDVHSAGLAGGVLVDRVVKVVDGATIVVDVDAWPPLFGVGAKIRLRGIDTPELRGKCTHEKILATKAKQFVESKVYGAKEIQLKGLGRGTFFRVVARVVVDGEDLGELIVREGLGREYSVREGRLSWCGGFR